MGSLPLNEDAFVDRSIYVRMSCGSAIRESTNTFGYLLACLAAEMMTTASVHKTIHR